MGSEYNRAKVFRSLIFLNLDFPDNCNNYVCISNIIPVKTLTTTYLHYIEASHLVCSENILNGVYMMGTLIVDRLNQ